MNSVHDLLAANLKELGLAPPRNIIQSLLMKDGYFVGHHLRYDGGYAIVRAGNIEIYGGGRMLLKTVPVDAGKAAA
jgi:hypothetical protein